MTDIRKCAQAVIDAHSKNSFITTRYPHLDVALVKLRQALAEPVEPVCWWNGKFYTCVKNEAGYDIPLYTTPPSVDALIADLMELHLTWEDYQDVKEVCDKYRGVK